MLADPRFYHLDTAMAVLDDRTIAYYPGAFTAHSRVDLEHVGAHSAISSMFRSYPAAGHLFCFDVKGK